MLIENRRREVYDFAVRRAEVLTRKDKNGKRVAQVVLVNMDVPEDFTGASIQKLQRRRAELKNVAFTEGGYPNLDYHSPQRGFMDYCGDFMPDKRGKEI